MTDSYVNVQHAEAAERRERASLFRALRVAVWIGIWTVSVPAFLGVAAGTGLGLALLIGGAR